MEPDRLESDPLEADRRELLQRIDDEVRMTARWTGCRRLSTAVRQALERVPREAFVRPEDRGSAYENRPLPIGYGQTISQPFIVAIMTELLDPQATDVVLDVGTGCGYQAAVLAELVQRVHGIELVGDLATSAAAVLAELGYDNVDVVRGDGYAGRPDHAPYDKILVAAAAPTLPAQLVDQLAPGGRMLIPVGRERSDQILTLVTKDAAGQTRVRGVLPVAFVPLVPGDA